MSGNISCRVPDRLGEQIERAADESQTFQSELVRRALRHYVRTNPDDLTAFQPGTTEKTQRSGQGESKGTGPAYDPVEDFQ